MALNHFHCAGRHIAFLSKETAKLFQHWLMAVQVTNDDGHMSTDLLAPSDAARVANRFRLDQSAATQ